MTDEVNAVVEALYQVGLATVVVNDSHGDMQNLLHTELDPRVEYIQSNIKPLGMVQGLDATFDGVIFLGYHAMAGTENGFLAHTGSGSVKGLWINGTEVGEGGLNALLARLQHTCGDDGHGAAAQTEHHGQDRLAVQAHEAEAAIEHDGQTWQIAGVLQEPKGQKKGAHNGQHDGKAVR